MKIKIDEPIHPVAGTPVIVGNMTGGRIFKGAIYQDPERKILAARGYFLVINACGVMSCVEVTQGTHFRDPYIIIEKSDNLDIKLV